MEKEIKLEDKIQIIAITDIEVSSFINTMLIEKYGCMFWMRNFMEKWIALIMEINML